MNRRDYVKSAALLAGAAAALELASSDAALAAGGSSAAYDKIAKTASHCIDTGLACAKHCEEQLGAGNKDMAACLASVQDMIASCEALKTLAIRGSKHTAAMAKTCAVVCADCAKACEPHVKMDVCKGCMDACKDCETACKAV